MGRAIRQAVRLVLVLAAGCSAAGQLPTDSPLAQSANGIIRTLAKPFESGDAVTPDPQAARLEVAPLESTAPPGTELLIVASVTDAEGQPRRGRPVEWVVER